MGGMRLHSAPQVRMRLLLKHPKQTSLTKSTCRYMGIAAVSLPSSLEGAREQMGFSWSKIGLYGRGEEGLRVEYHAQLHPDPALDVSDVN